MALTAARSELNIALVGDNETGQMLADASAQIERLEGKLRSLQKAGQSQASSAVAQAGALDTVNGRMKSLAGVADSAVEGLDRIKSTFDKVLGVAAFAAPVFAGIAAGVVALAEELFGANDELVRLEEEMTQGKADAEAFASSMRELTSAINGAVQSSVALTGQTATLRARLATLTGDLFTAEFERRNAETLAALKEIEAIDASIAESRSAQTKAREAEAAAERELAGARATAAELEVQIAREQMDLKLGLGTVDRETLQTKQIYLMRLRDEIRDNDAILANAQAKSKALENQVGLLSEQKGLLRDIANAIQQQVFEAPGAAAPARRPGGGGRPRADREREAAEALIESIKAEMASLYDLGAAAVDTEMEFERDIAAVEKARADRRAKELEAARKAAEEAAKLQQEMTEKARRDMAQPYLDFANVLSQNLGPELSFIEQAMAGVTAQFERFTEGQQGFAAAVAGSAHAVARSVAEQVGGVKALAAVDAAYHLYKGFGTAFTNPAESAGHFIAAAGLAGVASGIISTGGGGAGAAGGTGRTRGIARPPEREAAPASTQPASVTYNISAGVMDGQSVSRAIRQSERASRGSGYTREWAA